MQPRKQRKYRYNAPIHVRQKFMHSHLSPELRKKYLQRSLQVRKGDKVKVLRGQQKGKEGKVDRVNLKQEKIFLANIELSKKDGNKVPIGIHPSNVMIMDVDLSDKKRKQKISKDVGKEK